MGLDFKAYSQAFDDFILKAEKISDFESDEIHDALSGICPILRIAEVFAVYYENSLAEQTGEGDRRVFFKDKSCEPDRVRRFTVRETTGGGNIAVYNFYQKEGDTEWSEEERQKLHVLEKAMFSFNGRLRVMNMIENLTFYDRDLGVHNLQFFMKTAGSYIRSNRISQYCACCFNLKRFSIVNQRMGRRRGTAVMKNYVEELQGKLGENEYVCRIGGDNFIVLFLKEHLETVKEHLGGIGIVYDAENNRRIFISAYAGYYMIPNDCTSPGEIMDNASAEEHTAKNILKTNCVFFDDVLKTNRDEVKMVENSLAEALEREEFKVFYQPKVYLKNYTLHGAEALCRWHRHGKLISPGRFIPALEQSRAICSLDFYMLEHACRDIRRWLNEGRPVVKVSVNLSRRHLGDMDLLEHIISSIDKYSVPHEYIEIELTETTTDVDFDDLKKLVTGLREAGISTSVDDFGIGYSSLNLIKELPWNVLKIDKSFLPDECDGNSQKYAMLKHIIALAQDIGLECIVEGVETAEQVRLLKENNCFLAQGFYFDKPLPVEEFEKRLDELK